MREILFKAKRIDNGEWVEGYLFDNGFGGEKKKYFVGGLIIEKYNGTACDKWNVTGIYFYEIDPKTLCQFTGLCDKNSKKIWENDILMCHGNPVELVRATFGEFGVTDLETETVTDEVIGWHYEVIYTDELSRTEPYCYSMPLTKEYITRLEMEVVDNPELLQEECK